MQFVIDSLFDLSIRSLRHIATLFLMGSMILGVSYETSSAQSFNFKHFGPEDGYKRGIVMKVMQDRRGFLWIGSLHGLHRYDGYEFKEYTYTPDDSTGLSYSWVHALIEDHTGAIWAGTHGGGLNLLSADQEKFIHFRHDKNDSTSLSDDVLTTLYEDKSGTIWIGTETGGLNRFDRATKSFKAYYPFPGKFGTLGPNRINAIYEDPEGILWVGVGHWRVPGAIDNGRWDAREQGGLFIFDRELESFTRVVLHPEVAEKQNLEKVWAIHEDREGKLWIGTVGQGLKRLDKISGSITSYDFISHIPNDPFSNTIRALLEDSRGNIWVGTDISIHILHRKSDTFQDYYHDERISNSNSLFAIRELFQDRQGTVWIGASGGLARTTMPAGKFDKFLPGDSLPVGNLLNKNITGFHNTSAGELLVLTEGRGVYFFDPLTNTFSEFETIPGANKELYPYRILAAAPGLNSSLWLSTYNGEVVLYDPGIGIKDRLVFSEKNLGISTGSRISSILMRDGIRLTIAIGGNGIVVYDITDQSIKTYFPALDSVLPTAIAATWHILDKDENVLWLGTSNGLYEFDERKETFRRINELDIRKMYADDSGNIWLVTYQSGLFKYDIQSQTHEKILKEEDLNSDFLNCIIEDGSGKYWITTNFGISRYDSQKEQINTISFSDEDKTSAFSRSCHVLSDGRISLGDWEGRVTLFDPSQIQFTSTAPEVRLNKIYADDELVYSAYNRLDEASGASLIVPPGKNNLDFHFVGIHLDNPIQNQHAYKLEPFDKDWIESGIQRDAHYGRVPPGEYVFWLKASSSDGVWSEALKAITIKIPPPWWQSFWAYAFYVLAFLLGLFGLFRIRETQLRAQAAQEQAQMLVELDQVKSRFFTNISHEFRTPLTLMLGPVRDALEGAYGRIDANFTQHLQMVRRNGRRLEQLIGQLLDLSRLEAGRLPLHVCKRDFVAFVRGIFHSFSSLADRRSVSLSLDTPSDSLMLFFDADKIEKVLINLLSNAFKFTEDGDVISMSVASDETEVWLTVRDTGKGISKEDLPNVFDRFYQTDASSTRSHEGAGIGLALVKEIVELHHGKIEVESAPKSGTCFTIRLLLGSDHFVQEDFATEEQIEDFISEEQIETNTVLGELEESVASEEAPLVLIVDDNEDVRRYLASHLQAQYRLAHADDGNAGLEQARALKPDLIVSDVMMPGMNGFELCRLVKGDESLKHLPVLLLTARAAEEDKMEGLGLGADDYLTKPFSTKELLVRVENLILIRRRLRAMYSSKILVEPTHIEVDSAEAAFLERVKSVVEAQLSNTSFTVEFLADEVGISPKQLRRRLRASTELSAGGFIRSMRVQRAAQLLEQKWGTVAEVAHAVGFKSAKHFSTLFKSIYEVSPSEYPSKSAD